jgi:DNA polymerase III delta prime subunit
MNLTHHAYYIEGDLALFDAYTKEIPHFVAQKYEKFGIDESRELQQRASLKVFNDTALFLIGASTLSSEAQQALLKLFEEPQQGVIFVFVVPHGTLLPTLRSRMLEFPRETVQKNSLVESEETTRGLFSGQSRAFLKASPKERSDMIAKILKDEDDVKERVRSLLDGFEAELAKHIEKPAVHAGLEDIAKVRSYVGDRSAALKMLLEHLAVALPKL